MTMVTAPGMPNRDGIESDDEPGEQDDMGNSMRMLMRTSLQSGKGYR